jgi:hypothetical protein
VCGNLLLHLWHMTSGDPKDGTTDEVVSKVKIVNRQL